jgi:hypothetical protein
MRFNLSVWSGLNNEPLVIKSMYVCCMILISFGNSWLIFILGKTLGCVSSLDNSSNDNARGKVLMLNGLFAVGVADVAEVVCEAVPFASVWAVNDGAELTAVWACEPSIVVWLLGAVVWGAVTVGVGVINAFMGLTGDTGLAILVGFVTDFVQVFCVVIHVPLHIGWP